MKEILLRQAAALQRLDQLPGWFDTLNSHLVFHPDSDFRDYCIRDLQPGTKDVEAGWTQLFRPEESSVLNDAMARAFALCDEAGLDIYELGLESMQRLGLAPV